MDAKIGEDLLYYVWKTKNFKQNGLKTIEGLSIEIIDYGLQNPYSGPDFSNAKIRIGQTLWVGHVEMHINSSDWIRHNHQADSAYQNVILHVVFHHDKDIVFFEENENKITVPTLILGDRIPHHLIKNYKTLLSTKAWVPCEKLLPNLDHSRLDIWKNKLLVERIEEKTELISFLYQSSNDDWEKVLFVVLSRYFGATANTLAFEALANSIDYNVILRNGSSQIAIEAMLFGQAGMLKQEYTEDYPQFLMREYNFLQSKYQLKPLHSGNWKYSGVIPAGFPTIRIAQLSALIYKEKKIFSRCKEANTLLEVKPLFDGDVNEFWATHYTFDKESSKRDIKISPAFIDKLIINAIIPTLFLYGKLSGQEDISLKVLEWMYEINGESNSIVNKWKSCGLTVKSAFDTQSLIYLKKSYCDKKRCLSCDIGSQILKLN